MSATRAPRRACLKHWSYRCVVCGLSFEEYYGELGRDYIHVHHTLELSGVPPSYRVDPIKDLRPVCPNCHAMIHRGPGPALTVDELRRQIAQAGCKGPISVMADVVVRSYAATNPTLNGAAMTRGLAQLGGERPSAPRETAAGGTSAESLAGKAQWVRILEAEHGLPIEQIPGAVYALHYDPPRIVRSVSGDYAGPHPQSDSSGWLSAGPIRHYVGWTQQRDPRKRIGRHAPLGATEIVHLESGTMLDERELKRTGRCPRCAEPYRDSIASL